MFLRLFRSSVIGRVLIAFTAVMIAQPAFAYVGPGAGLTAIGTMVAVVAALILAVVGFVWYPLKRTFRKRSSADTKDGSK